MTGTTELHRRLNSARIIDVLPSGRRVEIDVYGADRLREAPTVNWAGLGSVEPADAAAYGALIVYAAGVAHALSSVEDES